MCQINFQLLEGYFKCKPFILHFVNHHLTCWIHFPNTNSIQTELFNPAIMGTQSLFQTVCAHTYPWATVYLSCCAFFDRCAYFAPSFVDCWQWHTDGLSQRNENAVYFVPLFVYKETDGVNILRCAWKLMARGKKQARCPWRSWPIAPYLLPETVQLDLQTLQETFSLTQLALGEAQGLIAFLHLWLHSFYLWTHDLV